jgi:hypothetical protein
LVILAVTGRDYTGILRTYKEISCYKLTSNYRAIHGNAGAKYRDNNAAAYNRSDGEYGGETGAARGAKGEVLIIARSLLARA